ncbi:hypothetical protein BDA99DRAFT_525103 [Phascolomyces articulosus]|uniref:DUF6532 domain-containing protein n=1 Tax=Phascolomyces articulosus TaxID=60185 RepID=A0AAD5JZ49_9FUNG|nr:hypothetical protein BDA99DRAFT_525103 [Phascolomyces articulosus]
MQRRTINLEGDQLKQFKNAAERYGFLENTFPDKQEISVMSRKIALDILGLPSDTRVIISEDLEKTFTTSIRTKRSNILNYNLPKFLKKYPFDMTLIPEEYQQPRQYLYNYITETGRFTRPGLAEKNGRLRSTIFADCIAECFLTRHFSKKNYDRERTEKLTKEIVALAYAMIYFIMVKEYTEYMEEDDKGECHEKMKKIQNREFKKGSYWSKVYENAAWGCTLSDSQWQKVLEIQQAAFDRRVKSNLKVDAVEEEMNPVDDFGSLSDDDY